MNENTINNDVTMPGESQRALLANRYRIIKQLGQGGMGSVWLAEDTQLDGKLFAIKMLPSILVANKRAFNQLKSEALVAMKLTHPNIVTLRAFEENNGNPFLVMDYIDGETLDDWLGDRVQELGVRSQESGVREVWPGRRPLRAAKSLEACERPREPRRKFFVKFAVIGFLASGLIGGVCALLGKKDSNDKFEVKDSNDKFEVIEDGMVQLWEGGPYWAAKNIGAEKPEDSGYYFWWGDTVGYKREGDKWVASDESDFNLSFSGDNTPTYGKDISELASEGWIEKKNDTYVLTSKHDAAQAHLGGAWRMPTNEEFDNLFSKCDWTWTTRNGVRGYIVRGRGNYASKSIFLPAAGYGYGASLYRSSGSYAYGACWSSVPYSGSYGAYALYFDSNGRCTGRNIRYYWQSVRPVQGFTK